MNTAYRDAVIELEDFLAKAGISVSEVSDYGALMTFSTVSIHSSVERSYPASINAHLLTSRSNTYEIGILEEVIDPVRFESDRTHLSNAFKRFGLDGSRLNSEDMQEGLRDYLKFSLARLVDFLVAHSEVILDDDEPYRASYLRKVEERLSQIGL